jgi:hypothetical protein
MSAHQLHGMLGVTYKAAWFMAHWIRVKSKAMMNLMGSYRSAGRSEWSNPARENPDPRRPIRYLPAYHPY